MRQFLGFKYPCTATKITEVIQGPSIVCIPALNKSSSPTPAQTDKNMASQIVNRMLRTIFSTRLGSLSKTGAPIKTRAINAYTIPKLIPKMVCGRKISSHRMKS